MAPPIPSLDIDEDGNLDLSRTELLSGFSDAESDITELTINNLAVSAGFISGNDSDGWTYTPADDFNGEVTISYAVTDPDGGTTLAAYSFNVASINDAPELIGEQRTLAGTQEDNDVSITESQLLAGYLDRDGDDLSVTTLTLADDSIGTLSGDATTGWTFSPNADWNGTVELNYSISDGQAESNSTINVSNSFQVFAVNDAPINNTPAATPVTGGQEDNDVAFTATQLLAGFTDAESDISELTIAGISANNGTISDDGAGNYSFSPDADFNGEVTLNYVVADPDGGNTLASTSFTIEAVNDGPEQLIDEPVLSFINEETTFTITSDQLLTSFVDREGDTLTVSGVEVDSAAGTITNNNDGSWTFTAANEFSGKVVVDYQVSDGSNIVDGNASMTVVATNDIPELDGSPVALADGSEDVVYTIKESDLLTGYTDGDINSTLSITGVMATGGIATDNDDGTWTFTPAEDYNGEINLTYVITDGEGGYALASTNFTLAAVNDAPERTAGDVVTLAVLEDSGTSSLGLNGVGYAPGGGNDELAQTLSYSITELPDSAIGVIQLADGSLANLGQDYSLEQIEGLQFATTQDGFGDTSFSFTVTDSEGGQLLESLNIKVIGVNEAPELTGTKKILANGEEDELYTINADDLLQGFTDRDGDTLSIVDVEANNGTLTDNEDGTYSFEPALNFNGIVSISYYIDDNNGIKVFSTNEFTLNAVNDDPEQSEEINTLQPGSEDNSYILTNTQLLRSFSDVDGDPLDVVSVDATNATVTDLGNGEWEITPAENFFGTIDLSYQVSDGTVSVNGVNSIEIEAVNDAPVATFTGIENVTEDDAVINGQLLRKMSITMIRRSATS